MRTEWDGVLCLQLGPVDRHFAVRITYQGGPFRADIEAIEIQTSQGWLRAPCRSAGHRAGPAGDRCRSAGGGTG
ncbi:hypothetical protein F1643_07790 [Azospirillum sp. INR13]|uniref:hypothetical protein n=1 Tax=Azospirillum sp. INR13 TaxID=2596919 RepID=UPI0018924AB7|nr:hypothetical protein [Azospirillum sp. INR13]MBF5094400.1 hypothetical protein [Azospirillum sp. INR13]